MNPTAATSAASGHERGPDDEWLHCNRCYNDARTLLAQEQAGSASASSSASAPSPNTSLFNATECGHVLCRGCAASATRVSAQLIECPVCAAQTEFRPVTGANGICPPDLEPYFGVVGQLMAALQSGIDFRLRNAGDLIRFLKGKVTQQRQAIERATEELRALKDLRARDAAHVEEIRRLRQEVQELRQQQQQQQDHVPPPPPPAVHQHSPPSAQQQSQARPQPRQFQFHPPRGSSVPPASLPVPPQQQQRQPPPPPPTPGQGSPMSLVGVRPPSSLSGAMMHHHAHPDLSSPHLRTTIPLSRRSSTLGFAPRHGASTSLGYHHAPAAPWPPSPQQSAASPINYQTQQQRGIQRAASIGPWAPQTAPRPPTSMSSRSGYRGGGGGGQRGSFLSSVASGQGHGASYSQTQSQPPPSRQYPVFNSAMRPR
ncbi:hypothetical protein H9P43_003255 [Blastocladiella emersonii ATCC 22665]|nr:hypothetical protein H9P43_003255 [Blastocladiella emersonii ATCC 22665]